MSSAIFCSQHKIFHQHRCVTHLYGISVCSLSELGFIGLLRLTGFKSAAVKTGTVFRRIFFLVYVSLLLNKEKMYKSATQVKPHQRDLAGPKIKAGTSVFAEAVLPNARWNTEFTDNLTAFLLVCYFYTSLLP